MDLLDLALRQCKRFVPSVQPSRRSRLSRPKCSRWRSCRSGRGRGRSWRWASNPATCSEEIESLEREISDHA
jgi:hypothetical protein